MRRRRLCQLSLLWRAVCGKRGGVVVGRGSKRIDLAAELNTNFASDLELSSGASDLRVGC